MTPLINEGPDDKSWTPWDTTIGGFWKGRKHWSEVLGDDALSFTPIPAPENEKDLRLATGTLENRRGKVQWLCGI